MTGMNISARAKIGLGLATLLGVVVYLVIVDYGINAGRIHRGVDVRGVDVGGLTTTEAADLLTERGTELEETPVIFTKEGLSCNFMPNELGWEARPFDTAVAAYRIGRGRSWLGALGTRVKAWVAGVTVDWLDEPDPEAVTRLIDLCERNARGVGYELKRYRLRQKIREAIRMWPRQPVNIPVES
jgi:hypothetical protein